MAYHPFRHLGLKLLSVAIAVLLWFTVSGEELVERSLRVPVELRNIPERLELVDNPPATVDVRGITTTSSLDHHNVLSFEIRGQLWSVPYPLELLLRSNLDLESGQVVLLEQTGKPKP